jgi:cytidylate kinase
MREQDLSGLLFHAAADFALRATTLLPPVIAIDGPSASGKGTVAQRVAQTLGFHFLDSGALYRLSALAAEQHGIALDNEPQLAALARKLDISFKGERIFLDGRDVEAALRSETCSANASRIAALPGLRQALLQRQRDFRALPGLVCDGRDIGSVVFPDAVLKVFLTASLEARAERRTKQLKEKGMYAKIQDVIEELKHRDERDSVRTVAPLKHFPDARLLDTTNLSIDQAVNQVVEWYRETSRE